MPREIRLYLIVPNAAQTAQNKNTFATSFFNNGNLETLANELKLLDASTQLALVASPNTKAGNGIAPLVPLALRDELQTAITTINSGLTVANRIRYYACAEISFSTFTAGNLIQSNGLNVAGRIGTPFTFEDAIADLGLVRLIPNV